jgi:probable rRNA maturation factor
MISIQIAEALSAKKIPSEMIDLCERAAQTTLARAHTSPIAGLTIVITDDDQLHQLNRNFLGIDAPTDVLSFPVEEIDPDSGEEYLGDTLISYPRAVAQADAGNHTVQDELQLLVVHGVLHLLGYDHNEGEKQVMWAIQSEILADLGCSINPL